MSLPATLTYFLDSSFFVLHVHKESYQFVNDFHTHHTNETTTMIANASFLLLVLALVSITTTTFAAEHIRGLSRRERDRFLKDLLVDETNLLAGSEMSMSIPHKKSKHTTALSKQNMSKISAPPKAANVKESEAGNSTKVVSKGSISKSHKKGTRSYKGSKGSAAPAYKSSAPTPTIMTLAPTTMSAAPSILTSAPTTTSTSKPV
jgi:hypothetical protein